MVRLHKDRTLAVVAVLCLVGALSVPPWRPGLMLIAIALAAYFFAKYVYDQ